MARVLRSLSKRFKSKNSSSNSTAQFDPSTQFLCKVILLDNTDLNIVLDKKALGQDACNKVFVHLDLEETDYFGLTYTDHDSTQWLDPIKKIRKQIPKGRCATFRFQVKFFSSDPSNLREEFTRYLFFLQLKADIKSGKLPCPRQQTTELAALQLQSEFGDYDPNEHDEAFVSEFRFHNELQDEQMEIDILKKYKTLVGVSPSEAERLYLDVAKTLQFYGVDLHDVVAKDGNSYKLGLTPTGVVVFDKDTLVGVLFWQFIQAVNFHNRRLTVVLDEHSYNEIQQHTFVFSLISNRACKRMWKRSVEFHTFFRMKSHRPAKRSAAEQFFRLSSSYQHRGRTEFENVNMPPTRRERSVVKFERKPSQRYGPRQSHVQRMKNRALADQTAEQPTLFEDSKLLERSNNVFENSNSSFSEQADMHNASTIPANRTYTVAMSPTKIATPLVNPQQTRTIKPGPTVIDEAVQFCPATVGIKCISDTNVVKPIQLSGSDKKPESEKSVSASAIQPVSSRIPRFGKQAPKPSISGPRLYDEAADLVEEPNGAMVSSCSGELKAHGKGPNKTTFIPVIQSTSRISNPKIMTQH